MRWSIVVALMFAGAAGTPTAVEQFKQLQQQARTAREMRDKPARIEALAKLAVLLHDSPAMMETQAIAFAQANETEQALSALEKFAAMGQYDADIASSDAFAKLRDLPRFQAAMAKMAANNSAVVEAETAIVLGDEGLLAEDIDFDRASQSFLLTSVLEKKIVRVDQAGKTTDFATSPSGWPMLAIKIDGDRGRVWATEVALEGEGFSAKSDWGKSAVLCFELKTGKLLRRIEAPEAALGDMVLNAKGEPIVSDGQGGALYQVQEGKLKLLNGSDFISPQTPVLVPGSSKLFVPDYARGIAIVDMKDGRVSWLKGERFALTGIDGLYFDDGDLIATQNGSSPERVVRFKLNHSRDEVISEEVVERATKTLGDPTHGVVAMGKFYYIANSGWNYVDEHGVLKPGTKREPPRIMKVRLRGAK